MGFDFYMIVDEADGPRVTQALDEFGYWEGNVVMGTGIANYLAVDDSILDNVLFRSYDDPTDVITYREFISEKWWPGPGETCIYWEEIAWGHRWTSDHKQKLYEILEGNGLLGVWAELLQAFEWASGVFDAVEGVFHNNDAIRETVGEIIAVPGREERDLLNGEQEMGNG